MSSTLNQIIGIQPLKIRFITNVNDNQPILFTRDKIHLETNENDDEEAFAATLSEYPFFTDQVFIPANQLIKLSKKKNKLTPYLTKMNFVNLFQHYQLRPQILMNETSMQKII